MATPKFKVGDVVNLKSDKVLKLTVNAINTNTSVGSTIEQSFNGSYECLWFDVTFELKTHDFLEEILELST